MPGPGPGCLQIRHRTAPHRPDGYSNLTTILKPRLRLVCVRHGTRDPADIRFPHDPASLSAQNDQSAIDCATPTRQLYCPEREQGHPGQAPEDVFGVVPTAGSGGDVMVIQQPERSCVLTINGGSSSLKFAIFPLNGPETLRPLLSGRIEQIGRSDARAAVTEVAGGVTESTAVNTPDLDSAAGWLIDWVEQREGWSSMAGIAHRIVHGGARYFKPERITTELLAELRRITPMDPDHLPGEIAVIERFRNRLPELPQVACFDTAFHHDMPRVAQIVPIPRRFQECGVRRYGFHGLSYSYLMEALVREAGPQAASGRIVLAHLGSGASLAAVRDGRPIDTTMALTPAAGLVMSTRSGDIDPGLPGFLARAEGVTIEQFDAMINHQSGLLGVSETSSDLRDLLAAEDHDVRAAEAVALFVYRIKKEIGALAAALGGLDILVFAGGIGENSPAIRARIGEGLGFLGIVLDESRNASGAPLISTDQALVQVRVIPTDEESMMARAASGLLAEVT
jgi:acetate kinase